MGKLIKWCLIVGFSCVIVGTAASTAALAMGADPRRQYYLLNGEFDLGFDGYDGTDDWADTESFENISSLKLDCNAGQVILETGDVDQVTINSEKAGRFSWRVNGETLEIESHRVRNIRHIDDWYRLVLQVPDGFVLDEFELDMNAGSFEADTLTAEQANIDLKAGNVQILAGTIGTLTADTAAGRMYCGAVVQGNARLECAAGEMDVLMQGSEEEYRTNVDCKVGTVRIGSHSLTALSSDRVYNRDAERSLEIECRTGAVGVAFTES